VPTKDPARRFADIIENINRIRSYTAGLGESEFVADLVARDATERCLSRISEAASQLGPIAEEKAPGLPWQSIRAFGNRLRHAYDNIDAAFIWEIVQKDLLPLEQGCKAALEDLAKDREGPP
jgi:uncharacterized protein with HEPN domain